MYKKSYVLFYSVVLCILVNAVSYGQNYALGLSSGSSSQGGCPDSPGLDINGRAITMEAWVYCTAPDDWTQMMMVGRNGLDGRGWTIWNGLHGYANGQQWSFELIIGTTAFSAESTNIQSKNVWIHLAGVYDGNEMRLYVNGTLEATTQVIESNKNIYTNDNNWFIGGRNADYFSGSIDEVRISSYVRYTSNFTPPTAPFTNDTYTRALWHFNEGTGTTSGDSSSYGNNLTLTNCTWVTGYPFSGGESITVTYPNGGETWTVGTTQTVTWTSQGTVGNVNIDLSTDGGTNWTTLVSNTGNDGSEAITVPNTPSTTCRIRVQEPDGTPSDISDNNFTIATSVEPTITVTYPNGGETWTVGTTQTVTWTSQGTVGNVNIDLSTNGGTNWTNLVSNTANDGSQAITVPNTPSTQCSIRVQEPDGSPTDTSNNNFTITSGGGGNDYALDYNGTNQYVEVPDNSVLDTSSITVECWFYPNAPFKGEQQLVAHNNWDTGTGYVLMINDSGKLVFRIHTANGVRQAVGTTNISTNVWHHALGTYDRVTVRVFLDGQMEGTYSTTEAIVDCTNPLRFGIGAYVLNYFWFDGVIDEVRISRIARYSASFSVPTGPYTTDSNTVGLWHFDEGTGTTTADASGNGNNGTLYNGPVWVTGRFGGGQTPAITVTAPNGGETWTVGTTQTVTWTSQGSVGNVNIDLSTDSGSTWTNLVSNTGNDGSQAITVPNTPSTQCRIRVQEPDGTPTDISDNNFTIASAVQPTITVTYPNGGETWTVGTTQTVTWTSQGTVGNVNIDLSTNGGTNWTTLVSNTGNDGSEAITVPNTPSTQCSIRVQEPDGSPTDTSDNNFTIALAPAITVTAPNGGETWTVGTTQTVTWTSQGSVGNVNIDLSTDGGSNWFNLVYDTVNDGSEPVVVPNTPSTNCKISIHELDGSPNDESDNNFTIVSGAQPTITVTVPNGGETWTAGTTQTVTWTSQGSVGNVNIDLSTDDGSNWFNLISDTENDGSEAVMIPELESSMCKIRVEETDGSPTDTSDNDFSIVRVSVSSPVISVSVTTMDFGKLDVGLAKTMKFNITNIGSGTLSGTISDNKTWIKVTPTTFDNLTNNQGIIVSVTVDNSILNEITGQFTGTITITSNGGADVLITVKVTATCVLVKPNPYDPEKGLLTFFGSGIVPKNTEIRIYTIGGNLVKTLTETSGRDEIDWDGTNEQGEKVVDGIYLYIYESPTEKGIGKFTVSK